MPDFLNKKIMGIPAYIWGILIIGAIGLGLLLRRRSGNQSAPDTAIPAEETAPITGTAGGGAGGGGVGGGSSEDQSAILDAIGQLGTDITGAIASIPIPTDIPAPAPAPPSASMLGPVAAQEPPSSSAQSAQAPPATVVTPPNPNVNAGPVPGATFTWLFSATTFHGEQLPAKATWAMTDKALFLKHLGARGLTYAQWKANHPAAALRVFGDR